MDITETKKSLYNVFSGLAVQLLNIAVGLMVPRLILLHYGSEVNGFLSSVMQIFQYVALLEAGVGAVALQFLYGKIYRADYAGISACLNAIVHYYYHAGAAYMVAILACATAYPFVIRTELSSALVFWIIIVSGLNGCLDFFTSGKYRVLLEADGRRYVLNTTVWIVTLAANFVKILLILHGGSVVVMQIGYCLVMLLQIVIICCYSVRHYQWLDRKAKPDYGAVSQKKSALIHQLSGLIFGSTDIILLSVMCNLKVVSVYTTYNMIVTLVANLLTQINSGVGFKLGQLYQADRERYLVYHHMFEIVNFVLVFAGFSVAYLCIIPFITLYTAGVSDINYQDQYLPILFILVQLLSCGRIATGNVIQYAGHFRKTQTRSIVESVINIVISIIGIYFWGIYGALLGTIVALLYRTNDIVWYSSVKLLEISPWYTYRRWFSNGVLFVGVVVWNEWHPIVANGYFELLLKAVGLGVGLLPAYMVVQMFVEKKYVDAFFRLRQL